MRKRMRVFIATLMGGVVLVSLGAVLALYSLEAAVAAMAVWSLPFIILQFLVFRCPHCRKLATITASWGSTPFVGDECRYCHESC